MGQFYSGVSQWMWLRLIDYDLDKQHNGVSRVRVSEREMESSLEIVSFPCIKNTPPVGV